MKINRNSLNCVDVACFQRLCVANLLFSSSLESALLWKVFFCSPGGSERQPTRRSPDLLSELNSKMLRKFKIISTCSHSDTHTRTLTHIHTTKCTPATRTHWVLLQPERLALWLAALPSDVTFLCGGGGQWIKATLSYLFTSIFLIRIIFYMYWKYKRLVSGVNIVKKIIILQLCDSLTCLIRTLKWNKSLILLLTPLKNVHIL